MTAWSGIISDKEDRRYAKAGFGRERGLGQRPAQLIIDVQYRTIGTSPKPYWEAVEEYPTSCGDVGWAAVERIAPILAQFRKKGFPVPYPYVAPKNVATDSGRLAAKIPSIMGIDEKAYDFVEEVAPRVGDVGAVVGRLDDFEERQRLVAKGDYDALDRRYKTDP